MPKLQVTFDKSQDRFPTDGSPLPLVNVKKVVLSNLNLDEATIVMHLIGLDIESQNSYTLPHNWTVIKLDVPYPTRWAGLFFKLDWLPENSKPSFTCELVPRV